MATKKEMIKALQDGGDGRSTHALNKLTPDELEAQLAQLEASKAAPKGKGRGKAKAKANGKGEEVSTGGGQINRDPSKWDEFGSRVNTRTGEINKLMLTGKYTYDELTEMGKVNPNYINVHMKHLASKGHQVEVNEKTGKIKATPAAA